jgi:hypothetical protein
MYRLISLAAGLAAAAGVLVGAAPAAEASPAGSHTTCFRLSDIQNTRMQGDRTLFMRSSTGAYYRMDFAADCNNAGSEPLILHPVDNSDEVCGAIGIDVRVRGTGAACLPTQLTRLTPDEVAAIPPADKP